MPLRPVLAALVAAALLAVPTTASASAEEPPFPFPGLGDVELPVDEVPVDPVPSDEPIEDEEEVELEEEEPPVVPPALLRRVWRMDVEANGFDADERVLAGTIQKLLKLPKAWRWMDDDLVDVDAAVLVGRTAKVLDEDGDRLRGTKAAAALDDADTVRVTAKVLPVEKWLEDEDGELQPTVRATRVVITG